VRFAVFFNVRRRCRLLLWRPTWRRHQQTNAQLLLKWTHNIAQVEFSLMSGNTFSTQFFSSYLWEYRRKSYIAETIFLDLHLSQTVSLWV